MVMVTSGFEASIVHELNGKSLFFLFLQFTTQELYSKINSS